MTDVPCAACGLPVSAAAAAAGTCPCCGHRLGAAVEVAAPPEPAPVPPAVPAPPLRWRRPAAAAAVFAAGVGAGYLLSARAAVGPPLAAEVASAPGPTAPEPARVVPVPVLLLLPAADPVRPQPAPAPRVAAGPKPPAPPGPLGAVFDRPDLVRLVVAADGTVTVEVSDVNADDVVTLTGRVTVLRLTGVNGRGRVDASRLTAGTVVLAGHLNAESDVSVTAPGGRVTVEGNLNGRARLEVAAAGGEVVFAARSDPLNGEAVAVVAARRVEVGGGLNSAARLTATLDRGGSLRVGTLTDRAEVVYRRAAASDPAPAVETGEVLGNARVVEGK